MRRMIDYGTKLLPEGKAPAENAYRIMPLKLAKLKKQSKKLLGIGFSRPVQAPYGTSVLSLKKKDSNLRWCIDRHISNKHTVCRKYPLPILTKSFNRSRGVKYFSKSDIRPMYCRVRATKARGLETTCVTEHGASLRPPSKGFSKLKEIQSIAKGGRCCFVRKVTLIPRLTNNKRQFAEGFLKRASSLTELLKNDIQWGGNLEWQAAFDGLKQAMIEGPSLGVVDATKPSKDKVEQLTVCSENICILLLMVDKGIRFSC
ncbi:reverse transcriptase [Cucumis melo var. makuwa]|uniref:Reverse transcriptase n=1 Tax=Cucumis melo var. makuwa TaxID=1194695 RepID=A0A5D3BG52_CUCMM|nr:reverse transcriptase [Cucumis melo var. makuwa]